MVDFVKDEFGYDMKWKKEWLPHYKMSDLMIEPTVSFISFPNNFPVEKKKFLGRASIKDSFGKNYDNFAVTMDDFEISAELKQKLLSIEYAVNAQVHLYNKNDLIPLCGKSGLGYYKTLQLFPVGYLDLGFVPLWSFPSSKKNDTRFTSIAPSLKLFKLGSIGYKLHGAAIIDDFNKAIKSKNSL